ncbi:NUDIX domain-containing protein [Pseudomonas sp. SWRI79]|uniref:NUDIX domain-containing protein n=1 Tax=Pseudomonas farris TaxID=2841207 RepID=A0ABS6Q3U3_9PSED|nr:NUDIX domain-containing protein [Pseudomonas farris]MBV4467383.1 NUDIX domain-containing protein [Pseudomonas farris]
MPRRRSASRILLVSPSHRLLLFKIHYKAGALAGMSYWATPGGGLRGDESFEAAAVRELYEETGLDVQSVGCSITRKEFLWQMPDGEHVLAVENYYVVNAGAEYCSTTGWSSQERDAVCEIRWWSESELMSSTEEILPPDLPILFGQALLMAPDGSD